MELEYHEKLIIAVLRIFNGFFAKHNYSLKGLTYGERDGDIITYKSNEKGFEIHIVFTWQNKGMNVDIIFYRKNIFSSVKSFSLNHEYNLLGKKENLILDEDNYITVLEFYYNIIKNKVIKIIEDKKF